MDELFLKEETHRVIGSAMNVLNSVGHGFYEKIYENALIAEFESKNIPFSQQQRFSIQYLNKVVGEFIPDMLVFNRIILELKTVDKITHHEYGQVLNYLRVTQCPVGLILNFKYPKLEWKRVVLS